jgi:GntR family transcriptional regulator/MocR family aminotransferase
MPENWSTSAAERDAAVVAGSRPGRAGDVTSSVDLHLDPAAVAGRRSGLERALRDAIRSGRLAPHTRLPSTRALAADLGISRGTVSAAFDQLVAEGYLTARQGSGTTVSELAASHPDTAGPPASTARPRHDLRPGKPDVSRFPAGAWLRSAKRALSTARAEVYDYGDPSGRIELRIALADYLARVRGVLAAPDQIVITSGYVQAIALLARVLRGTGTTTVAMEDPGLDFHRDVVARSGLTVAPVPVDEGGARPDALPSRAGAVVLTPAHQYPTGVILRPARRHALAEWARRTGGLIIEDDYDGEFRYDRQPVGAMQGMAPGHVAYVGSAAKTLAPGLRLAWMVLPHHLAGPVAEEKRHDDHQSAVIEQLTLADFIASHAYDKHIRACRLHYRRRRDLLITRLATGPVLPGLTVGGVAAGLQALASLPPGGPTEDAVLARAAQHGLAVGALSGLWHRPGEHHQGLLIGFATPGERAYPPALETLARVLHTAPRPANPGSPPS